MPGATGFAATLRIRMRIRARQRGRPETVCAYLGVIGQVAVQITRQRIDGANLG
jgi:hypothetical protein